MRLVYLRWRLLGGRGLLSAASCRPPGRALSEHCVRYLALPPGWRVLLAPDYEDVWFDGELLKDVTDSL
ncbi:immunity protein Imm33 domain-containing protein [Paraburkholderia youngii]|uniref:immunity protein Imm33 domain-containing protein n=1 Tax=Paraburkholderia youngii TaxID=2782701 RepID=UPI003F5EA6CE